MKTARTALLAAAGLIASTLLAAAQTGDFSAGSQAAASETSPQAADATATMRALVHDPVVTGSLVPVENAYDFNAPNGVPGFGPIDSAQADRRLAQIIIWE